jgi:hypothetical protein
MRVLFAVIGLFLIGCTQTEIPENDFTVSTPLNLSTFSTTPNPPTREGLVVFQFDDANASHYGASLTLDSHSLKGSFGIVTGVLDTTGKLTRTQVVDMAARGHEIHDHTLFHKAYFWGDVKYAPWWRGRIDSSLAIFAEMGLTTAGWNQPGGTGQGWSRALRDTLAQFYDYAAGRVDLAYKQRNNFHWRFKDDPLSLGRGGINSWGSNGETSAAAEVRKICALISDGYFQGLVVIPLFHSVLFSDSTEWALESLASFVADCGLENVTMAEAVQRTSVSQCGDHIDQIPNRGFWRDLDHNNRPDGWLSCFYAPAEIQGELGTNTVELYYGSNTTIYGPRSGSAILTFTARSNVPEDRIYVRLEFTEIFPKLPNYSYIESYRDVSVLLTDTWQTFRIPVNIAQRTDKITFRFLLVNDRMYVASASFLNCGTNARRTREELPH